MGLRAAVQALKKAESLKNKVQHCKDLLNDNDAWVCQQQLQKIYQQVLILDLEYALDRKVEQELWNLGFKNYIATLQSQAKDRKNPKRNESQAMLSWCLEAASGFYLTLLQEICTAFDLDLPFRRKGYVYGCTSPWKAVENLSSPHKSSCFYACQYCLVHLGDIARYRNQNKQAELFYRHAVSLSPSSGQPYNQLALLEASRGDKLGTVFHYARSVAVKHPFPVATANLAKTLSSALNDNSFNVDRKTKLTSQEYVAVFLKFHGILHNIGDLNVAVTYVKLLTETLTALVATESFNSWRLIQMLAINLYAFQHVAGSTIDGADLLTIEQLSSDERIARDCMLDLIAGSLSALLLPVYTIKSTVIDYFALPAIKLCLDWISLKPMVLKETAFTSRLQIWPSLCVLLNGLKSCIVDFKDNQYEKVPLPEDRDLQGFLPLQKAFESLRFTNTVLEGDTISLNKLRAVRILHLGHQLTQYSVHGTTSITIVTLGDIGSEQRFASLIEGAEPSNELMKELEELSLNKERGLLVSTSPVPSESTSSKGSWEADIPESSLEKRVGILKPQGSLERSRDSVTCEAMEGNLEVNSTLTIRKPRQNIAMQAIMRRAETEQKQVTFKNVSPVMVDENINKQKLVSTSPTRTGVREGRTKFQSGGLSPPILNGSSTMNLPIGVQVRPSLMQNQSSTLQAQTIPMHQNHSISVKLPVNIPQPSQITQFAVSTTASVCEQQRPEVTQFGQQGQQGLVQASYQPQTFNVQNPQFSKNFMNTRVPSITALYSMPVSSVGVLSTASQNVGLQPNILRNMQQSLQQNIQQNLNPAKSLHQRMNPSISQSSVLHQGIRLSPSSQIVSGVSQTIGIQQKPPAPLQQPQNVETHTHQMQGVMQNNTIRSIGVTVQSQFPNTSAPPNSANNMTNLPNYQKSFQQVSTSHVPNRSMSPTNMSNFQFNFSTNFGQNTYGPIYQKQISPIAYDKSSSQFSFPTQGGPSKAQQTTSNTYPMFRNYETKDFNLWKDTQPPQPPVAWWGSANATQMHSKDTIGVDSFQNWGTSLPTSNMIGKVPLISGNNYQQNPLQNRQCAGSTFDHTRSFELDQKQPQSPGTGNTYSLFSGNSWSSTSQASNPSKEEQAKRRLSQQSLWSGPGPSPLERLLEQQKSLREGGT